MAEPKWTPGPWRQPQRQCSARSKIRAINRDLQCLLMKWALSIEELENEERQWRQDGDYMIADLAEAEGHGMQRCWIDLYCLLHRHKALNEMRFEAALRKARGEDG